MDICQPATRRRNKPAGLDKREGKMGRKKMRINSTLISKQWISFALEEKCNTI